MHRDRHSLRVGPRALMRTLTWLRICAIAGQCIAVFTVSRILHLAIPELHLMVGIGTLAVFATFAAWRLRQPWPITEAETVGHIAVDTLVLSFLLYLTGGASNAFVTLLVLPIALCAAALSVSSVLVVAALSGLAYLYLLNWNLPLPSVDLRRANDFHLHVSGMAVNFVIMALMLGFFISRLATALREQQAEVQRIRERALRDEGILAIATQAAGAAHELNTPLSTMRTLLPELRREYANDDLLGGDLALLEDQVERCRSILREMVSVGKAQLSPEPEHTTLGAFVHSCLERFRLLRPEAELDEHLPVDAEGTVLNVQPGLRHAVINLLNNAADASAQNDSAQVSFEARLDGAWLELVVADRGPGFTGTEELADLGYTRKQTGLGLGLALAEATADRLRGELIAHNTPHGGQIRLRLPLAVIEHGDER
ncbi:ATP-binding protein [Oleiagrimonas sp. C23AA]|uniref:ATP-binding protein n=1 Tax=Oleiagrimonas sp. C23AA TaxID=2719047 RepID=UPI001423342B|nr:ATP-binding protein [Oleiagrimonas sp. C23AA]NII11422.1 HAMP domain-containing histidine kinase [Oleiagrimonas sp. C23AA]